MSVSFAWAYLVRLRHVLFLKLKRSAFASIDFKNYGHILFYLRLQYLGIEIVSCLLLLRMIRMDLGFKNLKKLVQLLCMGKVKVMEGRNISPAFQLVQEIL